MNDTIPPPDRDVKARELVIAVRAAELNSYVESIHAPECGIPNGEYWRVTVERVQLAPVRFDECEVYVTMTPVFAGEGVA